MERLALVWGNCQARALAALLAEPLSAQGFRVPEVPPVYLITPVQLARVHAQLDRVGLFVSHPVRDEYATPGCGTADVAARLPAGARVITVASCFDVGAFPWSANAHDGTGGRIDAPRTTYHDLRVLEGARRGLTAEQVLATWSDGAVADVAATSLAELQRRERAVDVAVSTWIRRPGAMHTMNHPSNETFRAVASAVLAAADLAEEVPTPEKELLGTIRLPVEPAAAALLGWPARPHWTVDGVDLPVGEVVGEHLAFYRRRPDVVADAVTRFGERLRMLRSSTTG